MSALAITGDEIPPRPGTPRGVEAVLRRGARGERVYRYRTRTTIAGRRVPSPEYDTIDDVLTFRALARVGRARGDVVTLSMQTSTFEQFAELLYWRRDAPDFLAPRTIKSDRSVYRNHLLPALGEVPIRQLNAPRIDDLRHDLLQTGRSPHTVRRALTILSSICSRAVTRGVLDFNPAREVPKPAIPRRATIYTPGADAIEALRRELDAASAALVSVLGYVGLRPNEALALEEHHLRRSTVLVEQRAIDGRFELGLKNSRGRERHSRSPKLYDAVRQDLAAHLEQRGPADGRAGRRLIFPGANGQLWSTYEYRRWREKVVAPAAKRAGVPITRPYDLRHGCASMLLHARRPLPEIAKHMGHTVATLDRYYAHLIEDLRDVEEITVEEQIAQARRG